MMHLSWTDLAARLKSPHAVRERGNVMRFLARQPERCFLMPLDLRANWLFRVIPPPEGASLSGRSPERIADARDAYRFWRPSALLLWFWPWTPAAQHLLLLGLAGSVLADLSLRDFRKIPFTCSYLPGKSKAHLVFWFGIIPLVFVIQGAVGLEQRAMANTVTTFAWPLFWSSPRSRRAGSPMPARHADRTQTQFEETPSDELVALGLNG